MTTLTDIQKLRIEIGDTDVSFPILDDQSYQYFLDKNNSSISRASIDAARAVLFQLSTMNSETVSVFSVKNTSAETYRQALLLYIKNQDLNPIYQNLQGYFSGISVSDMKTNNDNPDNKAIRPVREEYDLYLTSPFTVGWRF